MENIAVNKKIELQAALSKRRKSNYSLPMMKGDMELASQIEHLFKTDRKKFLGFIRQRVRSQEEAEDILQDVFTNVLAASANVQKPIENIARALVVHDGKLLVTRCVKRTAASLMRFCQVGMSNTGRRSK